MSLNIIKLVVGIDTLDEFALLQKNGAERVIFDGINGEQEANIVRTRYKPKRADDILRSEGSIYRVIKGRICCRQQIIGFDTYESKDKGTQCLILTDNKIIQTQSMSHRPFQGWRYFEESKAPKDRGVYVPRKGQDNAPPPEIGNALKDAGLL